MIKKAAPSRKMLPILFLIDVSGSMEFDAKIDSVNTAMNEALEELDARMSSSTDQEIMGNVLKFGCSEGEPCQWMYDSMTQLNAFTWANLEAESNTPLGEAYVELDRRLSSHGDGFLTSPSGSYAPVIILISDGAPSNRKKAAEGLDLLNTNSWFVHSERMAIAVGMTENDDTTFLDDFVRGSENGKVFHEVSNATALIAAIKGIVINTAMIGATRLKPENDAYKQQLNNLHEESPEEESEEEDDDEGGIEEPQPEPGSASNEEEEQDP